MRRKTGSPKWAKWLFGEDYHDKLLLVARLALPVVFRMNLTQFILSQYWLNHAWLSGVGSAAHRCSQRLQQLPPAFYQRHKTGDLTARLMTDTEQLKNVVVMVSGDIIKQPFTLIGAKAICSTRPSPSAAPSFCARHID